MVDSSECALAKSIFSLFYAEASKHSVNDYFRTILCDKETMKQCKTCFKKANKLRCGRRCAQKYNLRECALHNWPRFEGQYFCVFCLNPFASYTALAIHYLGHNFWDLKFFAMHPSILR